MGLLDTLLQADPNEVNNLGIERILGLCGNGKLTDDSQCSSELRNYFHKTRPENLPKYMQSCLQDPFENSEFVLQDIINEFGRILEYDVTNGRYRGKKTADVIGFDGLWFDAANEHSIVVEVKKTDAYSINLAIQAGYRENLIKSGKITKKSSILFVVGREDTGGLEPAVLGSQYSRNVRIVSANALANLVALKLNGDPNLVSKIHDLFIPFELVKLDRVIEIAFNAAENAEANVREAQEETTDVPPSEIVAEAKRHNSTPPDVIARFRDAMINAFADTHDTLQKKSRAMYWSADKALRAVFAFSKQYEEKNKTPFYWYAYHQSWDDFLGEAKEGYYVLGCIEQNAAYALPYKWIHSMMNDLSKTVSGDRFYCHVFLYPKAQGGGALWFKEGRLEPLEQFRIAVSVEP